MIALQNVTKRFRQATALEEVTLEIQSGETVVIWGASGSGKSTLLRLIAGLDLPSTGQIWMDGVCVSTPERATAPHTRHIGYMFQRSALWPHMTAVQNIAFALGKVTKKQANEQARNLLDQMALSHLADRYPDQLSGGEARRVALARALAPQPKYLLLDEPLSSLDAKSQELLLKLILGHTRSTQATLIFVTHSQHEASSIGSRVIPLEDGVTENVE